ncbi:MAG: FHA domain-containing protein [Thermoplasmatales archaeon]|nr:FHA domain-containing protein [Thermoplasmatales archaeon]
MAYLIATSANGIEKRIEIEKEIEIGRKRDGWELAVRKNREEIPLGIEDGAVSRAHARIYWMDNKLFIQDLRSKNGTYLDGEIIYGDSEIKKTSEIRLGSTKLKVIADVPTVEAKVGQIETKTEDLNEIRKKQLMDNIKRQYKLLHEYEKKRDLSERPKEIELFNDEITNITQPLNEYIIQYNRICQEEGMTTPQEVASILTELQVLKQRQQQIISKQDETLMAVWQARNAILKRITTVYQDSMRVLLSALDEQETNIVQAIVEDIDQKQLTEIEMTELLTAIQQGYTELQQKALPIFTAYEVSQETKKLPQVWNSPDISTGGKLKLSIPIIPKILTYETDLSVNVKESLNGFWKKFKKKLNEPIFAKDSKVLKDSNL